MRFVLVILLLIAPIEAGRAAPAAMGGPGAASCAEFAQAYKSNPVAAGNFYFAWAQGYISGLNSIALQTNQQFIDLAAMSFPDQQMFIRQYCDQHPLAAYVQGVLDLIERLPKRSPQSN